LPLPGSRHPFACTGCCVADVPKFPDRQLHANSCSVGVLRRRARSRQSSQHHPVMAWNDWPWHAGLGQVGFAASSGPSRSYRGFSRYVRPKHISGRSILHLHAAKARAAARRRGTASDRFLFLGPALIAKARARLIAG
jgi:hypothetical protein